MSRNNMQSETTKLFSSELNKNLYPVSADDYFNKTKIGAYVVSAWLVAIAVTLIFSWSYVDVAVRDLVMAIAAFSLAKLSEDNYNKANN